VSANNNREGLERQAQEAAKTIDPARIGQEILRRANAEMAERYGVEKAQGMTEDQAIDEAWARGRQQGLKDYRAMMKIQLEHEAANASDLEPTQAAPTPHATPADVNMLWEAIEQLKARIDALDVALEHDAANQAVLNNWMRTINEKLAALAEKPE
jgi:Cdc6-like AAA superfamily ATPase